MPVDAVLELLIMTSNDTIGHCHAATHHIGVFRQGAVRLLYRQTDRGSFEETKKFLRNAQPFLGCEILTLVDFLKEKGLLYEYLRYKYAEPLTEEEELPF